jgi:hypothetical protein
MAQSNSITKADVDRLCDIGAMCIGPQSKRSRAVNDDSDDDLEITYSSKDASTKEDLERDKRLRLAPGTTFASQSTEELRASLNSCRTELSNSNEKLQKLMPTGDDMYDLGKTYGGAQRIRLFEEIYPRSIYKKNAWGSHGMTVLHAAAGNGSLDILELLVNELRMDVNIKDNHGRTPLVRSVDEGKLEAAKFLVQNGADLSIKNYDLFVWEGYSRSTPVAVVDTAEWLRKYAKNNTNLFVEDRL